MKKTRLFELDILRCFAFFFIIVQHTFGGFSNRSDISWTNFLLSKFIFQLSDLGTPIFVFLTGIGLYYSHKEHLDVKDFYIKKLKFLILPYVFLSIALLVIRKEPIDKDLIWILLSGGAQYHLWYMAMIIRVYLYFPLVYYIMKFINKQSKYVVATCFPLFLYIYNFKINPYKIMPHIKNFLFSNPGDLQNRFINVSPIFYIFNFVLGIYVANHFETFKKVILKFKYLVFAVYGFFFANNFYVMLCKHFETEPSFTIRNAVIQAFYKPSGILFLYLVSYYLNDKFKLLSKVMIFISKYSFPAYMIHVVIVNKLSCKISLTNQIGTISKLWLYTAFYSIMISYILSFIPFSKYLIGCQTKFKNINILKSVKNYEFRFKS